MGLFSRKPKPKTCFLCKELVQADEIMAHYETHLIAVTDNNGYQAFTFECPRCGMMDLAWGGGAPDEERARSKAGAAVAVHLMQRHSIMM